jgi:ATP-dependent RNA helicase DDX19/DBP5
MADSSTSATPSLASRMTKDDKPVEEPTSDATATSQPTSSINPEDPSLAEAQNDGAFSAPGGTIMPEPEFDVNVTLADIQADPNNPLYSIKSFNDLDL